METLEFDTTELSLAAEFTLTEESDTQSQKVRLLARSAEPFYHSGYEVDILNDLYSMKIPKKLALDWEHGTIIGYSNHHEINSEGLFVSGVLTGSNETSKEVIQFSRDGIPLQASIAFRDGKIHYVKPFETVEANNRTYTAGERGLYVMRDNTLIAVAVCKNGYDNNTYAQFSKGTKVSLPIIKELTMSEASVEAEVKEEVVEAVESPTVEAEPVQEAEEAVQEAVVEVEFKLSISEIKAYLEEFGNEKALSYIVEGLNFSAAKEKHYEEVKKELADLKLSAKEIPAVTPVPFVRSDKEEFKLERNCNRAQSMLVKGFKKQ